MLPSVTLTLLIVTDGTGSLSIIVPTPCESLIVAFEASLKFTLNVSVASLTVSPFTGTMICCDVDPAGNVSVPDTAV